jgi:hypothetical protein
VNVEEVFGVSGKQVESHVEREQVDDKFKDALRTDKQIIVYGASKQGKTALVKKYIKYEENILISLSPRTTLKDIYQSILRKSDVILKTSFSEGTGDSTKIKSKASIQGAGLTHDHYLSNLIMYRSVKHVDPHCLLPADLQTCI